MSVESLEPIAIGDEQAKEKSLESPGITGAAKTS
jgi:hypothetical protein